MVSEEYRLLQWGKEKLQYLWPIWQFVCTLSYPFAKFPIFAMTQYQLNTKIEAKSCNIFGQFDEISLYSKYACTHSLTLFRNICKTDKFIAWPHLYSTTNHIIGGKGEELIVLVCFLTILSTDKLNMNAQNLIHLCNRKQMIHLLHW